MATIVTSSRTASTVVKTETASLAVAPGFRWHQVDCGTATAGSLAVNVDFGAGARTVKTIDFTDTARVSFLVFGDIKAISLVPTGVDVDYTVVYISLEEV